MRRVVVMNLLTIGEMGVRLALHNPSHAPPHYPTKEQRMELAASGNRSLTNDRPGVIARATQWAKRGIAGLDFASPVLDLGIRAYVASVFLQSGMTKIANWNGTLALFQNEYHVPLLSPTVAAYMGAGAELGLPAFLLLGLGTRAAAVALFVFNIIAVISYPDLSDIGLKDHQYWGLLMLITIFHGPGKLSLDHFLCRRYFQ
jgi:putative oxidoreductase